jgi:signal transduction histidine kinase
MNLRMRHLAEQAEAAQAAALAGTMQQLIDDLPEQISLLDRHGNILAVNHAWRETVEEHGYGAMPGNNYRTFCEDAAKDGYEPAIEAVRALDEFAQDKRSFWQLIYNGKERWHGRDFQICFRKIDVSGQSLILVTRFDLTEILELRRLKHQFSDSLLERQALERQRLGRELHDSASQLLTAIGLMLGSLKNQSPKPQAAGLIDEMQDLLTEAHREIRSISYLAHPPALEKLGLPAAMKSIVEGFARRTGLEASFEIQGDPVPMPSRAENAVYRVAQEALSNVNRHAHAGRVRLSLWFRGPMMHLVVADDGVGISGETRSGAGAAGVGLASMRTRLSEIGGRLSVRNLSPGTAIIATVCDES